MRKFLNSLVPSDMSNVLRGVGFHSKMTWHKNGHIIQWGVFPFTVFLFCFGNILHENDLIL